MPGHHYQHLQTQSGGLYPSCKLQGAPPRSVDVSSVCPSQTNFHISSPGEKLVEGEAGGGGGGGGGGLYPPYTVPCSQSPGGSWTGGSVPPGAPHYMPGGQPSPGPGQHPGQLPGQPPPPIQQGQSQQSGGAGAQAPLPSPLYPWMRSQFGNGNTSTLFISILYHITRIQTS